MFDTGIPFTSFLYMSTLIPRGESHESLLSLIGTYPFRIMRDSNQIASALYVFFVVNLTHAFVKEERIFDFPYWPCLLQWFQVELCNTVYDMKSKMLRSCIRCSIVRYALDLL